MGSLGVPELLVIFVIALIVFGPRKLPELGKSLGKGLAEFRRASNDLRNTLEEEVRNEERRSAILAPETPAVPASEPAPAPVPQVAPAPQVTQVAETVAHGPQGS